MYHGVIHIQVGPLNVGKNGFSIGKATMRDGGHRHEAAGGRGVVEEASYEHVGMSLVEL